LAARAACVKPSAMKAILTFVALALLSLSLSANCAEPAKGSDGKIRVLLITGGHDFEHDQFFQLFKDNPEITYKAFEQPAAQAEFSAEAAQNYDVIVTYDYGQKISAQAKADLVARLKEGKGLLVLHHAIATYPDWPEYWKIIGAHYYLAKTNINGVEKARSAYKHGMHFKLHVEDPAHPVTKGVSDFEIHDETYKWFDVAEDVHPLLTTEEPESNKVIAWAKTYEAARVVYLQSGHDHFAYDNPNYQKILRQAIRWTAKKD
jgi:type 1 glutamine amidotransferase